MNPVLAAALNYAARGWLVFPVPPGTKRSYKSAKHSDGRKWGATRDPDEIRRDWLQWPDAGIGIPTGIINNIVVLDCDTIAGHNVDGGLALAQLEAKHGLLPNTLNALSPSGSTHYYFQHPGGGIKIRNSASELGSGIDVRGDGGMVVAPRTVRPGGGSSYEWLNNNPIVPMPAWLISITREKPRTISERAVAAIRNNQRPSLCPRGRGHGYGLAALESETADLAGCAPGGRNHAANRASFSLHQLVAGGELDGAEVERRLIEACTANGLIADDGLHSVMRTIESGRRAGLASPRSRPQP